MTKRDDNDTTINGQKENIHLKIRQAPLLLTVSLVFGRMHKQLKNINKCIN